jgi:hypothetical protein
MPALRPRPAASRLLSTSPLAIPKRPALLTAHGGEPGTSQVRDTHETALGLIEILLSLVLSRTCLCTGSCRAWLTRRQACRMFARYCSRRERVRLCSCGTSKTRGLPHFRSYQPASPALSQRRPGDDPARPRCVSHVGAIIINVYRSFTRFYPGRCHDARQFQRGLSARKALRYWLRN